ncbi:MAG: hypothetical protein ACFE7R_04950 [Candidatus Hodarchaeota archaeon]
MSELKCCKLCGAFVTCDHKGECCPECEYFDPMDLLCMASHLKKKAKKTPVNRSEEEDDTFLFEDDEEDEIDDDMLPPERDVDDEDEFEDFSDDDWD